MSRNGSGTYSLPAGSIASDGQTIEATQHNTPLQDIETDMNTARPVVAGGTGATTASGARTNLGVAIGTDVQAYDAGLASIAGLTTDADKMVYTTASDTYAVADLTSFARTLLDDADAATAQATLKADTMSRYATYGGTANVVTLTTGVSLSSLTTGQEFRFRATSANTGATTINVDGIGALTAKTVTGSALPSGYIRTDVDTICRYDGTDIIVSRAVERGTNSNGYYTRFEDGTQICANDGVSTTSGATSTITLPASMSSTSYAISVGTNQLAVSRLVTTGNATTTGFDVASWNTTDGSDTVAPSFDYVAVGAWY